MTSGSCRPVVARRDFDPFLVTNISRLSLSAKRGLIHTFLTPFPPAAIEQLMRALATTWRSLRTYATDRKSRLGPALSLDHVRRFSLTSPAINIRTSRKAIPNTPASSSNEAGYCPSTGTSSGAHAGSRTPRLAQKLASLHATSLSGTAESQILSVRHFPPTHQDRY